MRYAWQPILSFGKPQLPTTPQWPRVLPFALTRADQYRPPPPPPPGSGAWSDQIKTEIEVAGALTDAQKATAEYWNEWGSAPATHLIELTIFAANVRGFRTDDVQEHHDTLQICIPFVNAQYVVQRQSETGETITHNLSARDVLVIPAGQPHAVDWKRLADIVSLQVSEAFVRQATGLDYLKLSDALTIRDPFITSSAAEVRSSIDGHAISPAFAEAIATVIAYRVGLRAGLKENRNEKQRAAELSPTQASRIVDFLDHRLDKSISLDDLAQLAGLTKWHFMRRLPTGSMSGAQFRVAVSFDHLIGSGEQHVWYRGA